MRSDSRRTQAIRAGRPGLFGQLVQRAGGEHGQRHRAQGRRAKTGRRQQRHFTQTSPSRASARRARAPVGCTRSTAASLPARSGRSRPFVLLNELAPWGHGNEVQVVEQFAQAVFVGQRPSGHHCPRLLSNGEPWAGPAHARAARLALSRPRWLACSVAPRTGWRKSPSSAGRLAGAPRSRPGVRRWQERLIRIGRQSFHVSREVLGDLDLGARLGRAMTLRRASQPDSGQSVCMPWRYRSGWTGTSGRSWFFADRVSDGRRAHHDFVRGGLAVPIFGRGFAKSRPAAIPDNVARTMSFRLREDVDHRSMVFAALEV